jgi:hypothetical protein
MRARAGIVAFVLVSAAGACSAFGSSPDDTPPPAGDAADGTSPEPPPLPPPDATPPPDAPPVGPSFCTPDAGHLLCDDFDEDTTLSTWQPAISDAGASLDVQSFATAPSPPNVLVVNARENSQAMLGKAIAIDGSGVTCAFDIRFEKRDAFESVLLTFALFTQAPRRTYRFETHVRPPPGTDYTYEIGEGPDGASLDPFITTTKFATSVWQHVTLTLAFGASPRVVFTIDGATVIGTPHYDLTGMPPTNAFTFALGLQTFPGTSTTGWQLEVDNVVCDATP